jgi:DNA-binding response OmpR family regulator
MGSVKILLVEDDQLFRETLKESLTAKKYTVSEAPNGNVAKNMIALSHYDLIISDIQMPFFSGLDLLEWVKKIIPLNLSL